MTPLNENIQEEEPDVEKDATDHNIREKLHLEGKLFISFMRLFHMIIYKQSLLHP